jgi:hypothetical protein
MDCGMLHDQNKDQRGSWSVLLLLLLRLYHLIHKHTCARTLRLSSSSAFGKTGFFSLSLTLSLTRSLPLLLVLFCRLYNILVAWRSGVSVKVRCPGEREARARRCVCCYCSRSAEEAVTILYAVWLLEPGLSDQFQGEPVSLLQSRRGAESSISVRPQQREQAGERARNTIIIPHALCRLLNRLFYLALTQTKTKTCSCIFIFVYIAVVENFC